MLYLRVACLLLAICLASPSLTSPSQASGFRLLRLDGQFVKWGETRFGTGAVLTWSIADRRQDFPNATNCRVLNPIDELVRRANTSVAALRDSFAEAFGLWAEVADVRFRYVSDNETADILVGAQGVPRDIAYANVWHEPSPEGDIARISRASICLNPEAPWEIAPDGDVETYHLGHVAAHEIGHTIGLDHPGRTGALMAYKYVEQGDALQPGDVAGVVSLYGPGPLRGIARNETTAD